MKKLLLKFKPSVPKRHLLLVAGIVWTFAGCMLFTRGAFYLVNSGNYLFWRFLIGLIAGMAFYFALFTRISHKHINRIRNIEIVDPCMFSFFNLRSYFMMAIMISAGVSLRKFDLIDKNILYNFYVCMGMPLLISASRFYHAWFTYKHWVEIHKDDEL